MAHTGLLLDMYIVETFSQFCPPFAGPIASQRPSCFSCAYAVAQHCNDASQMASQSGLSQVSGRLAAPGGGSSSPEPLGGASVRGRSGPLGPLAAVAGGGGGRGGGPAAGCDAADAREGW